MTKLQLIPFEGSLAAKLSAPAPNLSLYWLGQAGFVITFAGKRLLIDPYLSDTLATKYRDTPYSHERMAPAPITADELGEVDLVLVTHHHTDHMDGETLAKLARRLPDLKFVVPAASTELAMQRIGVEFDRLIAVDAGDSKSIAGMELTGMRAAHEALERTAEGYHRFLGYGMALGARKIFHSGDTIPFPGQVEEIKKFSPEIALFPVNGRSKILKDAGFAGNFTLQEAISLCEDCEIDSMIAHHYGMFAFNTIVPAEIDTAAEEAGTNLVRAQYNMEYRLDAD